MENQCCVFSFLRRSYSPGGVNRDKREKIDPKDYTIDKVTGQTVGRMPGTINGQQFIIQNCEDCNIYIFDHTATVSVDDCVNCRIFLGPVKSSVFIRDCKECKIVVACQQFRTRDCKHLDVFLFCGTQPSIEASTSVKFGCFQYSYPELADQFRKAELSVYNNNWSKVYDFTPVAGEENFTFMTQDVKVEDFVPLPSVEPFLEVIASTDPDKSLVPHTVGTQRKVSEESCLVVFFNDGQSHERCSSFLQEMKLNHSGCVLIQSKELTMQATDASRVFASEHYALAVQQGALIGLEYNGNNCCSACQETLVTVSKGSTGLVFVSSNPSAAQQHIENFYNFSEMQMSI